MKVALARQDGLGVANSKAFEIAKVTAATKNPDGDLFRRKDGSSEPNGVCAFKAYAKKTLQ